MATQRSVFSQAQAVADDSIRWYDVLGAMIAVVSDDESVLDRVEETYGTFRSTGERSNSAAIVTLRSVDLPAGCIVCDSTGYEQRWPDVSQATVAVLSRIVHNVLAWLQSQGIYAIHAGSVVYRGKALIIAGKSGQGKTTLVLSLLRQGFGLLSDEFAIVAPDASSILPYHRGLHVRPGTPELIPELRFLYERPQHHLGGGIEWALAPKELAHVFPNCLSDRAPLGALILLDGTPQAGKTPLIAPVPAALAAMEVLRGTWAASVDFAATLKRLGEVLQDVPCARVQTGDLEQTTKVIASWLETHNG